MANYILLDRIELNDTATSVTFDNIPQSGYTDLKVVVSARTNQGSPSDFTKIRFNGVSTSYSSRAAYGLSGSAASGTFTEILAACNGTTGTANTFGNAEYYIPNYRSSSNKSVSVDGVSETNAANEAYTWLSAGLWSNTAAITSFVLSPFNGTAFLAGSTFSLYGLAQVGTTPVVAPKADGGNVIGTDGTYWYHAFLSNGTFTPQVGITCEILQVAGGGGGTLYKGGGGGAGGVLSFSNQSLIQSGYTVTVGAGGVGDVGSGATSGVNSQFASLTASVGGGKGGGGYSGAASIGGSGGGGNYVYTAGAAGTSGQGNSGGTTSGGNSGSGGGGAGAVGANGGSTVGGNGGAGTNTWSSWLSATALGVSGYIAGGGGGGATNGSGGTGGSGGGGNGSAHNVVNGTAGTANTGGGGGGGGGDQASPFYGYNGGSGLIIIRYPIAS